MKMILSPQRTLLRALLIGGTAAVLNFGLGFLAATVLPDFGEPERSFHARYWIPIAVQWTSALVVCGVVIHMSGSGMPRRSTATIAGLILTLPIPVSAIAFYIDSLLADAPSFLILTFEIFFADRVFFFIAATVLMLVGLFLFSLWESRDEVLPLAPAVFGLPALLIFLPNGLAAYLPTTGVYVLDAAVWIAHFALLVTLLVWPTLLFVRRSRHYRDPQT